MTNIEIIFNQALSLLSTGKLTGKAKEFINQIKNYDKGRLKKLTSSEYRKLKEIVQDFTQVDNQ